MITILCQRFRKGIHPPPEFDIGGRSNGNRHPRPADEELEFIDKRTTGK
jgi:hypothetical protein